MLISCIISFFHNVFYAVKENLPLMSNTEIAVCKCFQFEQGYAFFVWHRVNVLVHSRLVIFVYLLSLPVAHLNDAPRRRLVVTGDNARIQDETTESSAWFFNPFPNKPWFLRVCSTSLLKTLWEKEKLLVTSNFSFSHRVFHPFG